MFTKPAAEVTPPNPNHQLWAEPGYGNAGYGRRPVPLWGPLVGSLQGHQSPFTAFMSESPPGHDFPTPGHPLPPAGSGPSQSSRNSGPSSVMGEARLWPEAGTLRDPAKQGLGPPRPQSPVLAVPSSRRYDRHGRLRTEHRLWHRELRDPSDRIIVQWRFICITHALNPTLQ